MQGQTHLSILTPLSSSSTSSSLSFSPRLVSTYLSSPWPIVPLPSLSNTWKPRMKSSACPTRPRSSALLAPSGCSNANRRGLTGGSCRLESTWTVEDRQEGVVVDCGAGGGVSGRRDGARARWTRGGRVDGLSRPVELASSATSFCVGFWPNARRTSPSDSCGIVPADRGSASSRSLGRGRGGRDGPAPRLSNRANASLASVQPRAGQRCVREVGLGEKRTGVVGLQRTG